MGRHGLEPVRLRDSRQAFRQPFYALVVHLDALRPDERRLTRRVREWLGVPVIFIQSTALSDDVTALMRHGAEDVITGNVGVDFAAARIASVVRPLVGRNPPRGSRVSVGNKVIDLRERVVTSPRGDSEVLPLSELLVLRTLVHAGGGAVTYTELAAALSGVGARRVSMSSIRRVVRRLRELLEDNPIAPSLLLTVWGVGYRIAIDESPEGAAVEGIET